MIKLKSQYKTPLLLCICALTILCGILIFNAQKSETDINVQMQDFPTGTSVNYTITANRNILKQGIKTLSKDKKLNLSIPANSLKQDQKTLQYQLQIKTPTSNTKEQTKNPAKMLDLLLDLNRDTGNISLSGSGFNSLSNALSVKKGNNRENISSDWAGLITHDSPNKNLETNEQYHENIEIAFQNFGLMGDIDQLGSGKMEVIIPTGDASGSDRSKVRERYNWALRKMTEELSAIMVLQTTTIGMFFDAKMQMKQQRKHQELRARAHKDYHPSDQMCRVGTFIRSVAHTENKAEVNKHALNKIMMNQYLAAPNSSAAHSLQINDLAETSAYSDFYCDPRDNNGATDKICTNIVGPPTPAQLNRLNSDIDYVRTIEGNLTLDIDFADGPLTGTPANDLTDDEGSVIALAKNLYFPNIFELPTSEEVSKNMRPHYDSRSFAAKMNVAHSSFLNIVGMKSSAPRGQPTTTTATAPPPPPQMVNPRNPAPTALTEDSGWAYMKAMLREFGIQDENGSGDTNDEIENLLGERPSYYAQMEILTKKIYQHPNFYTNLYDKPVNVDRIGASLDAITLMHQRDRFESLLRREMLTSILIEEELAKHVEGVNAAIYEQIQNPEQ